VSVIDFETFLLTIAVAAVTLRAADALPCDEQSGCREEPVADHAE
jgi:hypothetical protein